MLTVTLLLLYRKYRPSIDITRKGDVLFWYNKHQERHYYKLFNIFNNNL